MNHLHPTKGYTIHEIVIALFILGLLAVATFAFIALIHFILKVW